LSKTEEIVQGVLAGNKRSIAKAITLIENNAPEAKKLLAHVYSTFILTQEKLI